MRRVCGLMLFCFGAGMTLKMFLPETFSVLLIAAACLCLGFHLFCR